MSGIYSGQCVVSGDFPPLVSSAVCGQRRQSTATRREKTATANLGGGDGEGRRRIDDCVRRTFSWNARTRGVCVCVCECNDLC